jgi:diaminopimelate decarboxylase
VTEHSWRPDFRHYPDVDGQADLLRDLVARHSPPVFLTDREILRQRYRRMRSCLDRLWPNSKVAYSFKTNYWVAESRTLQELGCWAEVVSSREYDLARSLGFEGKEIVFNGPYKSNQALARALQDNATINLNDHDELDRLLELLASDGRRRGVGLRLRCTLDKVGGSRFGFSLDSDEAREAARRIKSSEHLDVEGLHLHMLGDTDDPACYAEGCRRVAEFATEHLPQQGNSLRYLDLGGGYPAHSPPPYSKSSWNPLPIESYLEAMTAVLRPVFSAANAPLLILEPGRYLVCDSMIFVSRVISRKQEKGQQNLVADASITMVPLTHYCPQILRVFTADFEPRHSADRSETVLYGASCREDDLLFRGPLDRAQVGDYLVHYAVGHYNNSLSPAFIFATPQVIFYDGRP